jgi:glycyl-tRNA synthetase alpha subunit
MVPEAYSFICKDASKEDYYLVIESVESDSVGDWNLVFEAPVNGRSVHQFLFCFYYENVFWLRCDDHSCHSDWQVDL